MDGQESKVSLRVELLHHVAWYVVRSEKDMRPSRKTCVLALPILVVDCISNICRECGTDGIWKVSGGLLANTMSGVM